MKNHILLLAFFAVFFNSGFAQLLNEDFDGVSEDELPEGWSTSMTFGEEWTITSEGVPNSIPNHARLPISSAVYESALESTHFSTTGFTDITISWMAKTSLNPDPIVLEYAIGTKADWTPIQYTSSADSSYSLQTAVLPASVNNQSAVYIRWKVNSFSGGNNYYVDDVSITGTQVPPTIYYSKASSNTQLNNLSSWSDTEDENGDPPTDFVTPNTIFVVDDPESTIAGDWPSSGIIERVQIAAGADFTIPPNYPLTANVNVESGGELILMNDLLPNLTVVGSNSTINYAQSGTVNIANVVYGNLTISGGGVYPLGEHFSRIRGDLRLENGEIILSTNDLYNLTIEGDLVSTGGTIRGSNRSNLTLETETSLSDDIPFSNSYQILNNFTINKPGIAVALGSDLTIAGQLTLTAGALHVGSNTLTLSGANTAGASPQLVTTSSSNLTFSGDRQNVTIPASVTTLNNLVINYTRSTGVQLMNNIQVEGSLSVNPGSYFNAGAFEITGAGSAGINGTVLTAHADGVDGTFSGLSGGFTLNAGSTINYNGTGAQTISAVGGAGYGHLVLSNAGVKSAGSETINIRNNFTVNGSASLDAGASTFHFTGEGPRTLSGGVTFHNLTLTTPDSTTSTATLGGDLDLTGDLAVGEGATLLAADGGTIDIAGEWTIDGAFDHAGNSLVAFTGDAQSIASGGSPFYNLTLSGTGIKSLDDNLATANDLTIEQGITLDPGAFNAAISGSLTNNGTVEAGSGNVSVSGVLQNDGTFSSGGGTLTISGNFVNNGTFNANDGTLIFDGVTAISGSAADLTANHIEVTGTLTAPPVLNAQGNWNVTGTFNANSGLVVFNGSSAQTTQGASTFYNLTLNNSAGLTLSGNNHNIVNTLKLQNGTLNTSDALTLVSTQAGTARLAKVESGADISGLVTVQRYIDASQSHWRHCGVSVEGQTLGDWTPENHIKLSSPSSVYFHSETDSAGEGWFVPSALSDEVNLGQGVKLWLWNPTFFSQGNRTLDNTGTVHHGDFDFNVTKTESGFGSGGWNYLANPYPCEIDWEAESGWTKTGLNGTIYIYDAVQQNYISYNSGTGGISNGVIASGQAFFVRAEEESPQLIVNEDAKVESGATFYRKKAIDKELTLTLSNTQNKYDQTFIRFMPEASDQYDFYDGKKMYGSHVNISSKAEGALFSINSLADNLSGGRSIPLEVRVNKKGRHTLSFEGLDSFDPAVEIKFIDHQSDSVVDVRAVREYTFDMPNFIENERFEILMGESLTLSLGDAVAASGEMVAIPITVENYKDVLTTQFSVNWDPADLEFISVTDFGFSSISSANFNTSGAGSGYFSFSWDDATLQGVSMNPGDTLFVINMEATMPMDSETEISFSDTPLPVEASDKSYTEVSVALKNGKVTVPELLKIAGTIKNNAGLPLKNAEVVVKEGVNAHRVSTDESGGFEIEMAQGKTYTLTPETVDEPAISGLSTIDIALIRRHILDLKKFDNPVHWLAADLNQSKTISTLDIAVLRSIILGNGTFRPKWRFVPEAQLTTESIFDADTFLTVNTASSVSNINFTGIKLGDVNDSWDGSELRQNDQQGLELIVDRGQVAQEKVKVPIRVRNFEQVSAYQFTVSWDPSGMKLNEITENPYNAYFGVANLDKGRLSVAWDHESGESLDIEDFAELMILEFTAKEASANVQITSDITPILFADADLKPVPFSIFNVEDEKESNFSVSVYPNPVSDKANFNIFAPESGIVNIEIIDLTGKLVKGLNNVNVTKGQNRLEIALGNDEKNHLAGLLIYKVKYNNAEQYHGKLLLRKQ